jgi:serine/threonine-protein kinase
MAAPAPGTEIGPYRIDGVIGAGSMGDVYRAVDVGLNRGVAVKILSERHRESNELRARFTREGRAVAAISHPNVVQVFATGTFQDRPYIAMELLEGTDLASAVDARGPLPALSAARAILDAARGLHAASRAGLIHRDVKPSNLVLLADGRVKVTDFGLAKPVDPGSEPALTALGVVVGTPDYIAPEQARGETIDERVDLYALGGTLYYLLTGIPPFRTGVPVEDKYLKVVARHLKNPPPDARERNPAADPALAELAKRLLAKKPAERPDYPALIAELERIVAGLEGRGSPSASIPPAPSGTAGHLARTPFIGGGDPLALEDDAAATQAHRRSRSSRVRAEPAPSGSDGTRDVRRSRAPRAGVLPRWLWAVSLLSAGVFVTGLVIYLTRDHDAEGAPAAGGAHDASLASGGGSGSAIAAPPIDATPPPPPTPPAGMVLVKKKDGAPWLFVDARPVTAADYAATFPKTKKPTAAQANQPVKSVPYAFARAYADITRKRLLTGEEWEAAIQTPGVIAQPDLFEWVGPAVGGDAPVRAPGRIGTRPLTAQKDVTFRLGQDLTP